ncbi:MAG: V-type ATP synthase subunit D [Rhabdochlamydiaceae bacterium]
MVKLTKTELRDQQDRLNQLNKYLPTLQLKKSLLLSELESLQLKLEELFVKIEECKKLIEKDSSFFMHPTSKVLINRIHVKQVITAKENIAGLELPVFQEVVFAEDFYSLIFAPIWQEYVLQKVKELIVFQQHLQIEEEKKKKLQKELRDVSIRVNLFEKIMIPRAVDNIKKIKIFLGDQQLSSIAQAKMSKKKIIEKGLLSHDH